VASNYVISLDELGKHNVNVSGGKGANLGELIKIGISVPNGFVVTTSSFDNFIQTYNFGNRIQEIVERTNVEDTAMLLKASQEIKEIVLSRELPTEVTLKVTKAYGNLSDNDEAKLSSIGQKGPPPIVAVRSSATTEDLPTASFAGQHATLGEKHLIESIRKCWASLFEPRAIFYRAKYGFSRASIAVIVQKMVNSEKSGIMFTMDPITGENIILIEVIWGLGESIVGG